MGVTGCCSVIKYIIVLLNIIFWLIGLAILLLAGYMLVEPSFLFSMVQAEHNYYIGISLVLIVGILMVIGSFLGCFGACRESQCMLVTFFCCILVILVAQIAAGSWAYYNKDQLDKIIRSSVEYTVKEEYGVIEPRSLVFDGIQKHLNCCGATNYHDWSTAKFNTRNQPEPKNFLDTVKLTVQNAVVFKLPLSCCKTDVPKDDCKKYVDSVSVAAILNPYLNSAGCKDKIVEEIDRHMYLIVGLEILIVIVELIVMIFALLLCCAIKRNDHYKA